MLERLSLLNYFKVVDEVFKKAHVKHTRHLNTNMQKDQNRDVRLEQLDWTCKLNHIY